MRTKVKPGLRIRLVQAAERRIQEGGIGALSLRKLAQDTGVTTMATYHHFANKQALLVEIAINGFTELSGELSKACQVTASPQEAVTATMRAYFRFALAKPHIYQLMFGQVIQGKTAIPEFKEVARHSFYIMADAIKARLEHNDHEVDRDAVGISFWGTLHGLVCLVADGTILYKSRSEEKIERLIEQAVKGLFYFY